MQDCINSRALEMELPQWCTKPSNIESHLFALSTCPDTTDPQIDINDIDLTLSHGINSYSMSIREPRPSVIYVIELQFSHFLSGQTSGTWLNLQTSHTALLQHTTSQRTCGGIWALSLLNWNSVGWRKENITQCISTELHLFYTDLPANNLSLYDVYVIF